MIEKLSKKTARRSIETTKKDEISILYEIYKSFLLFKHLQLNFQKENEAIVIRFLIKRKKSYNFQNCARVSITQTQC